MITEDYVNFAVSKLLKEKGFECATLHYYYDKDGDLLFSAWRVDVGKNEFVAPTLQMAMKWLREVHKIYMYVAHDSMENTWFARVYNDHKMLSDVDNHSTYEEACEAAIKYCLEKLI